MIILKKLTGNASFSISREATAIIDLFDVADTMQFLLFFNGSIQTKLDTIPKMSPVDVASNDRSMILRTGFNQTQSSFVNGQTHLRGNTIDLIDDFKALGQLLIRDCKLWHRIESKPAPYPPATSQLTRPQPRTTSHILPNNHSSIRFGCFENGRAIDLRDIQDGSKEFTYYGILWILMLSTANFQSERSTAEVQIDFDPRTSPPRMNSRFIDCTPELQNTVNGVLQNVG